MTNNLVTIKITDNDSLLQACDILHDAKFYLDALLMDKEQGLWKAHFEREFFEDPDLMIHEPKLLFLRKTTFPLADAELTLTGIKSYEIVDKARIGRYTFEECRIKNNIFTFLFCENMKMFLTFKDAPQGSLVDLKLLDKQSSLYSYRNPFKDKKG